jgi:hypothetical protein
MDSIPSTAKIKKKILFSQDFFPPPQATVIYFVTGKTGLNFVVVVIVFGGTGV